MDITTTPLTRTITKTQIAVVVAILATIPTSKAISQSINPTTSTPSANEVEPRLESSASFKLPDGRIIAIHREAQLNEQRSRAVYFHRPIFSFDKNPQHKSQQEKLNSQIVWDREQSDGKEYILLRATVSSPEFRELARTAVIEQDPSIHKEKPGISERDIDVRPWPLKLLRLEARNSLTNELYGESVRKPLTASGDKIEISMSIKSDKLESFFNALNNGRMEFFPEYTFNNSIVAFGQAATRITSGLSVEIKNLLSSEQLEVGAPIFQNERRNIETKLQQSIVTTIRATDSSVLAHIGTDDISKQIFTSTPIPFEQLDDDNTLLRRVEGYLVPIINQMLQDNEESTQTTITNENKRIRDVSIGVGEKGPQLAGKLTGEQTDRLVKDHKITFKEKQDTKVLQASQIEINYIRSGWQDNIYETFRTVYLAVGRDNTFMQDSPVRASFTTDKFSDAIGNGTIEVAPHALVPRGVAVCSFRADVPKGFVALDGSHERRFPEENWLHSNLRGKALPNLKGTFLRGAETSPDIGKALGGNNFTIPEVAINPIEDRTFSLKRKGEASVINPPRNSLSEKRLQCGNSDNSRCREVSQRIPLTTELTFTGEIEGSLTIPGHTIDFSNPANQPPSIGCQWIVRID